LKEDNCHVGELLFRILLASLALRGQIGKALDSPAHLFLG